MASHRRLKRRTLRWERYVSRYTPPHDFFELPDIKEPRGYWRAYGALNYELLKRRERRWALMPHDEVPF